MCVVCFLLSLLNHIEIGTNTPIRLTQCRTQFKSLGVKRLRALH